MRACVAEVLYRGRRAVSMRCRFESKRELDARCGKSRSWDHRQRVQDAEHLQRLEERKKASEQPLLAVRDGRSRRERRRAGLDSLSLAEWHRQGLLAASHVTFEVHSLFLRGKMGRPASSPPFTDEDSSRPPDMLGRKLGGSGTCWAYVRASSSGKRLRLSMKRGPRGEVFEGK